MYAFPRRVEGADAYFVVGGTFTVADREIPEVREKDLIPWEASPKAAYEIMEHARKLLLGLDSKSLGDIQKQQRLALREARLRAKMVDRMNRTPPSKPGSIRTWAEKWLARFKFSKGHR